MQRARLIGALLALATAAAGCSDPGPSDLDATEAVFLETCAPGGTPLEERVCRCAFDAITADLSASGLERLDRNLRDDPDTVPPEVTEAALGCAAAPITPPTPRPTTSTTAPADDETTTTERDP